MGGPATGEVPFLQRDRSPFRYVDVMRLDREIQNRIEDLKRETLQISDALALVFAETRMNSLRTQDMISKSDPLSETERQSLERLRGMSTPTSEERREWSTLESREPLSSSESWDLDLVTDLL